MPSLYDITVPTFTCALNNAAVVMRKGAEHFRDQPQALEDILQMKLVDDMLPFTFQAWSVRHHTLDAIQGIIAGKFTVPEPVPALDYAGFQKMLTETLEELSAVDREAVDAAQNGPVIFTFGELEIPFTAENFALTFSLPNLYFHLTTLYDMLRIRGVPLGKADYLKSMKVGLPQ
ncbi:MAG: DUF1993 family protein [Parahaliea sp.]